MNLKEMEMELAFANRQFDLLGASRKRMMRRTAQASIQRDVLVDAVRHAVEINNLEKLKQLLIDVDSQKGLWLPQTGTDRADTYQSEEQLAYWSIK